MKFVGFLLAAFVISASGSIHQGIKNTKVERNIDLNSQFVRQSHSIAFQNTGSEDTTEYFLAIKEDAVPHISLLSASDDTGSLTTSFSQVEKGFQLVKVNLRSPLKAGASSTFKFNLVLTHTLSPYPAAISQTEKQFVLFSDNLYFASPYRTQVQTTTVKLATSNIKSNTEHQPTSKKGDTITYGPYEDREPFSFSELKIHFENNKPFITVTEMVKEIEVSHWGNVAVEETYQLQHDGAVLKGTFSRYDFQRNPYASPSSVTVMKQILPVGATDVYYRDEIGNVTTSHLSFNQKGVLLELTPRYPLFGGWKAAWYQGYNLPLDSFLFTDASDSSQYVLNITFATSFEDAVIDLLTVRVILPEGATDVQIHTPFDVNEPKHSLHFTYLDTYGRPVISVQKKNLISDHNQYFQVTYKFGKFSALHEPFLLISAFFLFFLFVMIYMRFDFKIGETRKSTIDEKVEDLFLQIKDFIDTFNGHHDSLNKALQKYISSQNSGQYRSEYNNISRAIENLKEEFKKAIVQMEAVNPEIGKKLKEVEKKQWQKNHDHNELLDLGVRFAEKKLSKESYEAKKADKEKSFNAATEEIQDIFDELGSS